MEQTLSHTAVLQASADEIWEACKHVDAIFCDLLPEYFVKVEYEQGHGEPGSIRVITTGPAIKHTRLLKERMDKFDDATKTLGYTVLEGDARYSAFSAEIQFVAKDAAVTEGTWTARFVPVGEMGPPEHIKAVAKLVFQTLEKAVQAKKTFTHTETLDVSPEALWNACKHVDEILLKQMPQHFESSTMVEGHGGPGTVRVIKFGPAVKFAETVTEGMDFINPEEKRMGCTYTVLKGDPRYNRYKYFAATMHFGAGPSAGSTSAGPSAVWEATYVPDGYNYFAATMHFGVGPSAGSTSAVWEATYVPDGDMGPPEHVRDVVMRVWKALAAAVKANPERYA